MRTPCNHHRRRPRANALPPWLSAFTLIEMLTVIAIIASASSSPAS